MYTSYSTMLQHHSNLVFLGEAGCGKSEIALNYAVQLAGNAAGRGVHLFDLDQTKPIYRSRDARDVLAQHSVTLHHEQHDFDSPTIVGGVAECLHSPDTYAILDIGGGEAGARIIGRFARQLNAENTRVFYVVNPYRPWSRELLALDSTLSAILRACRIQTVRFLCNPNLGAGTTAEEFLTGLQKARDMLEGHAVIEGASVREELYNDVAPGAGLPVLPLQLFLKYEWIDDE